MADYSEEHSVARHAATKAAELIRQFQEKKNFDVSLKGLNELVTDADVAVEKEIKRIIAEKYPHDQILGEESPDNKKVTEGRVWIIDPIDGTTNFVHGFPVYGVSIGFWEDMQPTVAVVIEVNSSEIFEAVKDQGATCNGEQMSVSKVETLEQALIGTGFPYRNLSLVENYLRLFEWLWHQTQSVRRPGVASYDLCCIAAGGGTTVFMNMH